MTTIFRHVYLDGQRLDVPTSYPLDESSQLFDNVSAASYGLSTTATGLENSAAMERALAAAHRVYVPFGVYPVADQYAGAASRRICIRVPANREIYGPGTLQFTTQIGSTDLYGILSIVGSNVRISGLTFDDNHDSSDGSSCRAQGVVSGDGEDSSIVANIENVIIDDCKFTNNFYPVIIRAAAGTTLLFQDWQLTRCRGAANQQATYSGGFIFRANTPTATPGVRPIRNVYAAFNTMRYATNSGGVQIFGTSGATLAFNTAEDCLYSAVQTEQGCDHVVLMGNRTLRSGRGVWIDDSKYVAAIGNVIDVTETQPPDSGTPVRQGLYFTRQGFAPETDYEATGLVAVGNVVIDAPITSSSFGVGPTATFGSITAVANDVSYTDENDMLGTALGLSSGGSKVVGLNSLKGGDTSTIGMSNNTNEPVTLVGNVTSKVGAEASSGIIVSGDPDMLAGLNDFVNGVGGLTGVRASVGNRAAGVTLPIGQQSHYMQFGSGSPEGVVAGTTGDVLQRTDGIVSSTYYVKVGSGNTGWSPVLARVSGATGARPTIAAAAGIGTTYFDTTLGFQIVWNGTDWVNGSGVVV